MSYIYKADLNDPRVSATFDQKGGVKKEKEQGWNYGEILSSRFQIDELVNVLEIIDKFKEKYPNDDIIQTFEDIVRNEICHIVGGSID